MSLRPSRGQLFWLINLAMSLVGVSLLGYIIWDFDQFDQLSLRIGASAVLALLPLLILLDIRAEQKSFHGFDRYTSGVMVIAVLLFLIAFGGRRESTSMVLNGASLVASILPLVAYVMIVRKNRFMLVAVIPTVFAGLVYLYLQVRSDINTEHLLILVPFVLSVGIPWISALRLSLEVAKRTRHLHLSGPFMESLTMLLVAVPLVVLAILSVMAVTDGQHWIALAGIIVSFLFSSAVATPFARFLRALGGFDKSRELDHPEPRRSRSHTQ